MAPRGRGVLLLTGSPGAGKTTALRRAVAKVADVGIRGFTTDEIREDGGRVGFRIETFDGASAVLAHVAIRSLHRVSKYGVDVETLDRVLAEQFPRGHAGVVVIDEIGKMECLSGRFVETVEELLESARVFVATVALRGGGLIERVKRRPDAEVWNVTRSNRDEMPERVADWIRTSLSASAGRGTA